MLQMNVLVNGRGAAGGILLYVDANHNTFLSMQISSIVTDGNQSTVTGRGIYLSKTGPRFVTFQLDVTDSPSGGTIELRLSNGYDSGIVPVSQVME